MSYIKYMQTVTIPKTKYTEILDNQKKLQSQIITLREFVIEIAQDEIKPSAARRLERLSREIDQGKGKFFKSWKEALGYLDRL